MKLSINIFSSDWAEHTSYGRQARELTYGLEALDVHVNCYGPDAEQMGRPRRAATGGIFLGYPTAYESLGDYLGPLAQMGPRIAMTHWESTQVPDGWVDVLNQMDATIVASRFVEETLIDCGLDSPLYVEALGISDAFTYQERAVSDDAPLTFIAIADRGERKGAHIALAAFMRAFAQDDRYRLLIKSTKPLNVARALPPNIRVVCEKFDDGGMAALYKQAHIMIFPSAGEGFGFPPREFAATGGLALATGWSGIADCLPHWGFSIPDYQLVNAWQGHPDHEGLGQWAAIDPVLLAQKLRWLSEHYHFMREVCARQAAFVHETYQWSRFAEATLTIWKQALEQHYGSQ